jgi:perosamine synthetase
MIPRHQLDISYTNLIKGLLPFISRKIPDLDFYFQDPRHLFVSLSVRTCWDLILQSLSLPPGSEVVMSDINIADMVKITRNHGLIPVPLEFDQDNLEIDYNTLKNKITPKTKIILIAQLFGAKSNLDVFRKIKKSHPEILLVEDLAQSFASGHAHHPDVDISMYSFGTIKTRTALGGSVALIKDEALLSKMRELNGSYPIMQHSKFIKKALKVFCLKVISNPVIFGLTHKVFRLLKRDIDQALSNAVKGFAGDRLIPQLRQQPPKQMLHLLKLQLFSKNKSIIFDQQKNARHILKMLRNSGCILSTSSKNNFFWILPCKTNQPQKLITELRTHGIDASQRSSQMCNITSQGDHVKPLENLVYLPNNQYLSQYKLSKIAETINQHIES